MNRRDLVFLALMGLFIPQLLWAQGRHTKVQYDDSFRFGSQPLEQTHTRYFHMLTTLAEEDADGGMMRFWGPQLDEFFENVCQNLGLSENDVYKYLLYPTYFDELEKLVLANQLSSAHFDSLMTLTREMTVSGSQPSDRPFLFLAGQASKSPTAPLDRSLDRRRWEDRFVEVRDDTILVWLPNEEVRNYQRCVLYRTVYDFLATPIGPNLPEGVLGFVPRHDPNLPIVIYASLGEHRLRRTAQHEIAHAVVENIAKYLRRLAVTRNRHAEKDSSTQHDWRPSRGGFSAITHENYAEYLAFPHGEMEPTLRSALIEMVAENEIDGLAAISVGARTIASSYIEGPARLVFLAEKFGRDVPLKLLVNYYSNSKGFLDQLEDMTGYSLTTLEHLYRRWLREELWAEYLATDIPDTVGAVIANGLSGVNRDGHTMVQRFEKGRQKVVLTPDKSRGEAMTIVADLDGAERLPLFSSSDFRNGRVVTSTRERNKESLAIWDHENGLRKRSLSLLGAVREIRDPRLSPSGDAVVFRVVDRSGRNAIGYLNLRTNEEKLLTEYEWFEMAYPRFAENESDIVYISTNTPDHRSDVFMLNIDSGIRRNLTRSPGVSEREPVVINGRLVCFSDRTGVPTPVEQLADGTHRRLVHLPFPVSRMQVGDSTLVMVANSLRHQNQPAARAIWGFPLRKFGLDQRAPQNPTIAANLISHWYASASLASANPSPSDQAAERQIYGVNMTKIRELSPMFPTGPSPYHDTSGVGLRVSPYKQKWQLLPLGVNLSGSGTRASGLSFFGINTEFHDRSLIVAAGQRGDFDRFGMMQFRNQAARTHWNVAVFHRTLLRKRFDPDNSETISSGRNEKETGLLLGTRFHKSLVTRFGTSLALTRRADERGKIITRIADRTSMQTEAPVLGFQLPDIDPRQWKYSIGGIDDVSLLTSKSDLALARFSDLSKNLSETHTDFLASSEYSRANATISTFFSRDTRVWSDYRGPNSGSLFVLSVSSGFNLRGHRILMDAAQQDSLRQRVSPGLDRVGASFLFSTHRRVNFLDFAFRTRAFLNFGPQALTYGLGNIHTVSGFTHGFLRSERVAYLNLESRAQLWDYSRIRFPIRHLTLPAADGFAFVDGGVGDGDSPIYSYGIGLRLRYGFLGWEWRHQFRDGLRNQNGLTFVW